MIYFDIIVFWDFWLRLELRTYAEQWTRLNIKQIFTKERMCVRVRLYMRTNDQNRPYRQVSGICQAHKATRFLASFSTTFNFTRC